VALGVTMFEWHSASSTLGGSITNVTRKIFPARVFPLESAIIYLITNYHPWDHGWKGGSSKSEEVDLISVNHFMRSAEIVFHFLMKPFTTDYIVHSESRCAVSASPGDRREAGRGWCIEGGLSSLTW